MDHSCGVKVRFAEGFIVVNFFSNYMTPVYSGNGFIKQNGNVQRGLNFCQVIAQSKTAKTRIFNEL